LEFAGFVIPAQAGIQDLQAKQLPIQDRSLRMNKDEKLSDVPGTQLGMSKIVLFIFF